jgi:lactoylglutathione lyase
MVRTLGLSHINLNVADVARSMRFYRELFGMEVIHDYQGPIGPHPQGRQAVLSTPGAKDLIAIMYIPGEWVGPAGMNHFGFTLLNDEDVDAAVAAAQRLGGTLKRRGSAEVDGIVERFAYVSDPDGYVVELNAQRVLLGRKRAVRRNPS